MQVVHKYGGTSVASLEKIQAVAAHVAALKQAGHSIAVVASAMGASTDKLKAMADAIGPGLSPREMDTLLATGEQQTVALLALAIQKHGVPAVSLTGAQCGFITTDHHTRARIKRIDGARLRQIVKDGAVPVVAGFQGMDEQGNITTLGRGGSDTTAVALAAALGWDCEIYTDVDGICTADPRKAPGARRIPTITYDEMMELAALGAGVLETRSVELAKKYGVKLYLGRALGTDKRKGTYIMDSVSHFEDMPVTGISSTAGRSTLSARGPAGGDWVSRLFGLVAGYDISVDTIAMQGEADGQCVVTFCCGSDSAERLMQEVRREALPVALDERAGLSRVSLVGAGMIARSGVAARAFNLLSAAGIPYYHITTSEMAISLTVESERETAAIQTLADGFELLEAASGGQNP